MMKKTETRNNLILKIEEIDKRIRFLASSLDDLIETGKAITSVQDKNEKELDIMFLTSIIKSFRDKSIKS